MPSRLLLTSVAVAALAAPAAAQYYPGSDGVLTPDNRYLAFVGPSDGSTGVFLHDRHTGAFTLVSVAGDGLARPGASGVGLAPWAIGDGVAIGVSDDGRIVAFPSTAQLAADDVDDRLDVYLRDRLTGETVRVSRGLGGPPDGPSWAPRVSGDGRFVAFASAASNLVPGDTNGVEDVFVFERDTGTVTRVSVSQAGMQSDQPSIRPAISADGAIIAFISYAATLAPGAPTCYVSAPPSPQDRPCGQVFVHDRLAGTTTRVSPLLSDRTMTNTDVSADGLLVAGLSGGVRFSLYSSEYVFVYDRSTGRMIREIVHEALPEPGFTGVTDDYPLRNVDLSADGRYVAVGPNLRSGQNDLLTTTHVHAVPRAGRPERRNRGVDEGLWSHAGQLIGLSGDGHLVLESTGTGGSGLIRISSRDVDADGMLDAWERFFGLDPSVANHLADADGDGVSNAAEYRVGGNPTGGVSRYLAESAYSEWFRTTYAIFNPTATEARVALRYAVSADRWDSGTFVRLRPGEQTVIDLEPLVPGSFAAILEANVPVIAERTMTWDATGFGSHAEVAQTGPSTTWLFAEGATGGGFDLFYLLFNPTSEPAHVTITYLRPAPAPPLVTRQTVPPNARVTIHVDEADPALADTDVAASIVSDRPLVAERAMYLTTGSQLFAAGHVSAGVVEPALRWYLAEGATGPFFDTFVLVMNPFSRDARVRVTYVLPGGEPVVTEHLVPRDSRISIAVDDEHERLANTAVSTVVEAMDGTPVVVERAMWWPSGAWQEGHATAGATATGRMWAFANGDLAYTRMRPVHEPGGETYLLILNASDLAGTATIRLTAPCLHECGPPSVALPPHSRVTVPLSVLRPGNVGDSHFGIRVESDGPDIVVERAIYKESGEVVWAAGSVVMGTRLP